MRQLSNPQALAVSVTNHTPSGLNVVIVQRIARDLCSSPLGCSAGACRGQHPAAARRVAPTPLAIGLVALAGLGILFMALVEAKRRITSLDQRSGELARVKLELETTVRALQQRHRELQASELRYRGLVEQMGDVILRKLPDGRLTFVNDAFCKTFGTQRERALGRTVPRRLSPDERSSRAAFAVRSFVDAARALRSTLRTTMGWRWFAWEDYVIRNDTGQVTEIQSVARDITDQKVLETELREARDKAEDANRAKSMFLANMSHEIRTPMNGVHRHGGSPARHGARRPSSATTSTPCASPASALLDIINDILDFSKIEAGAMPMEEHGVLAAHAHGKRGRLLAHRSFEKAIDIATYAHARLSGRRPRRPRAACARSCSTCVGNAVKFTDVRRRAHLGHTRCRPALSSRFEVSRHRYRHLRGGRYRRSFGNSPRPTPVSRANTAAPASGLAITQRLVNAMGGTHRRDEPTAARTAASGSRCR